jgi:hypothetical protein
MHRGVNKFFKTLASWRVFSIFTGELTSIFTRKDTCLQNLHHDEGGRIMKEEEDRKQLAKNIVRVSKRGKNPRQTGEWVYIFTRQS